MKCPVCKSEKLVNTQYESVPVKSCAVCEGQLVRTSRLTAIKTKREKSDEEFLNELASPNANDTEKVIFCPSCLRRMTRRKESVGKQRFFVDECTKCECVWFDAGELAKIQLHYEESEQGTEMLRFHERLTNMTQEERAELDERISKLPKARILDREDYALLAYLWTRGF